MGVRACVRAADYNRPGSNRFPSAVSLNNAGYGSTWPEMSGCFGQRADTRRGLNN